MTTEDLGTTNNKRETTVQDEHLVHKFYPSKKSSGFHPKKSEGFQTKKRILYANHNGELMRIKTIIIIVVTILFTIALMQNTDPDHLNFLWATFELSKLSMLLVVAIVAFILGYLVGRPKKVRQLGGGNAGDDLGRNDPDTLSNEDKDYIH